MQKKNSIYQKQQAVLINNKQICTFDSLYFAPTTLEDICDGLRIYKHKKVSPIILVHVDGVDNYKYIQKYINAIIRFNKDISYYNQLNVEIRVRKENVEVLGILIDSIQQCKISLVCDSNMIQNINSIDINKIDFLRINYDNSYGDSITDICFENSKCFVLGRFLLNNGIDFVKIQKKLEEAGFDGIQLIKGHNMLLDEPLDETQKQLLLNLKRKAGKCKVFLEENLERTVQPLFTIRDEDQGLCFATLLFLTIRNGSLVRCPYKDIIYNLRTENNVFKERKIINSIEEKCLDCGYISDNILYRKIFQILE